jgi:hypothetical protein
MLDLANAPASIMYLMWRRSVGPSKEEREQQPLIKNGIPTYNCADVKYGCNRGYDSGIIAGNA